MLKAAKSSDSDDPDSTRQSQHLLEVAAAHKEKASDTRLGKPRTTKPSGLNKIGNAQKANSVNAERKAKREEAEAAKNGGIRISGQIWMTSRSNPGRKMEVVRTIVWLAAGKVTQGSLASAM